MNITNLKDLQEALASLPEGATANVIGEDLEAGNFNDAHIELPDGQVLDIAYSGPVQEGYVSPFEALN